MSALCFVVPGAWKCLVPGASKCLVLGRFVGTEVCGPRRRMGRLRGPLHLPAVRLVGKRKHGRALAQRKQVEVAAPLERSEQVTRIPPPAAQLRIEGITGIKSNPPDGV